MSCLVTSVQSVHIWTDLWLSILSLSKVALLLDSLEIDISNAASHYILEDRKWDRVKLEQFLHPSIVRIIFFILLWFLFVMTRMLFYGKIHLWVSLIFPSFTSGLAGLSFSLICSPFGDRLRYRMFKLRLEKLCRILYPSYAIQEWALLVSSVGVVSEPSKLILPLRRFRCTLLLSWTYILLGSYCIMDSLTSLVRIWVHLWFNEYVNITLSQCLK